MGRRRKAWRDKSRPRCVRWYEYGAHGQRIARSKTFASIKNAVAFERQFNARADLKELGQVIPIALEDAIRQFISGCSQLASGSLNVYSGVLGALVKSLGPSATVSTILPADIDRHIARISTGVSKATVMTHFRVISRFFNWCIADDQRYALSNPTKGATSKPRGKFVRRKVVPTDAQIESLMDAIAEEDRRLAVAIAITTGLDRGVIDTLRADDVCLDDGVIRTTRRKTGTNVSVPIHPSLRSSLQQRVDRTEPMLPLLSGLRGRRGKYDWFRKAAVAAGLPASFRFRDLRSVAASRLIRSGVPAAEVQKLLGHSSIEMTTRHYHMPDPATVERSNQLSLPGFPQPPESTEG